MAAIDFNLVAKAFANEGREKAMREDPVLWVQGRTGEHVWSKQQEVLRSLRDHKRTLVASAHAQGKATSLDQTVETPRGRVRMGDLRVGDLVYAPNGRPTPVVATSPVWEDRDLYRVTFDDGHTATVDGAHEWAVIDLHHRPKKVRDWRDHWDDTRVYETSWMHANQRSGGQNRFRVPTARAVDNPRAELPLDPYVLGVWLGDGTSVRPDLTIGKQDHFIIEEVQRRGYPLHLLPSAEITWSLGDGTGGVLNALRTLGVLGTKHVPEQYMSASIEQRLDLLRGVMDTDGTINENGHVSIDLCNRDLAESVRRLAESLGFKATFRTEPATLNGRVVGTRYRMALTSIDTNPFLLPRKADRWTGPKGQASRATQRTIVSIEKVGTGPTRCIQVADDSHLFLLEGHTATHNSWLASRAVGWWLDAHPHDPTETRVITTAPSWNQVKNIMWAYLENVQALAGIPGRITGKAEWTFPGYKAPTAFGRKPADYDDSTFQGIHSTYVLAVIDEAGGVAENIFTSVETITTNKHARILAIANPDDPNSYMAKIWRDQSMLPVEERDWNLITISAFDSPNFTGEKVPAKLQDNLLQKVWVEDAEKRWGKNDPRYHSKVLARFPEIGEDGLFNLGRVLQSMNTHKEFDYDPNAPVSLGVDVGLSVSGDYSVIAACQDGRVSILEKVKGYDGNRLARLIGEKCQTLNVKDIRVDAVGVGRGVQTVLGNHVPEGTPVYWVVGNEKTHDPIRWYNFRAAMYDTLSQRINTGEVSIPPDEAAGDKTEGLFDEFRTIRYEYRGTKLLIKSKEQIKKEGGHSPDVLDAIAYACLPMSLLTGQQDTLVDADTLEADMTEDFPAIDEWGNEEWAIAPA